MKYFTLIWAFDTLKLDYCLFSLYLGHSVLHDLIDLYFPMTDLQKSKAGLEEISQSPNVEHVTSLRKSPLLFLAQHKKYSDHLFSNNSFIHPRCFLSIWVLRKMKPELDYGVSIHHEQMHLSLCMESNSECICHQWGDYWGESHERKISFNL